MVAEDAIPEVLALLGIAGPGPAMPLGSTPSPERTDTQDGEWVLADWRELTLSRVRSGQAEWVELRGAGPVFRATRTKAILLSALEGIIESWAAGIEPPLAKLDCTFRMLGGTPRRVEVRHKDWRPMRLSQKHAQGLVHFREHVRRFAQAAD